MSVGLFGGRSPRVVEEEEDKGEKERNLRLQKSYKKLKGRTWLKALKSSGYSWNYVREVTHSQKRTKGVCGTNGGPTS